MQRYAFHVVFACVMGLCRSDDDDKPQCICKPSMKLDTETSRVPICNNATYDWLLNVALAEVTRQRERADVETADNEVLRQQLSDHHATIQTLKSRVADLAHQLHSTQHTLIELQDSYSDQATQHHNNAPSVSRDCADIQRGFHYSGIYTVYPQGQMATKQDAGLEVFCDLNTDGGGWLVFQRRQDGSQPFDKGWTQYKKGFGRIAKEFWLGNDNLHQILSQGRYELRVDLTDYKGQTYHATYDSFMVDSEENLYKLTVGQYKGNAGDALNHHNNSPFSTSERDHDKSRSGNCSKLFGGGGWWFVRCYDCNLNGHYGNRHGNEMIVWYQLHHDHESLKHVEMKVRPAGYSSHIN